MVCRCQDCRDQAVSSLPSPIRGRFHIGHANNLYGPGDNYHPDNSHVVPTLIRRLHQSKQDGAPTATVWAAADT
jgi:hypothetical protein